MKIEDTANKNIDDDIPVQDFIKILIAAGKSKQSLVPQVLQTLQGKLDIHPNIDTHLTSSPIQTWSAKTIHKTPNLMEEFLLYLLFFEDENFEDRNWILAVCSYLYSVVTPLSTTFPPQNIIQMAGTAQLPNLSI